MAKENKKRISERPLFVYLFTLTGLAVLLTLLALFNSKSLEVLDTYFLYGGVITLLLGLFFLNRGSRLNQSKYIKNDDYFNKVRTQERPTERIVWAVILAGITITIIGFFGNYFLIR